MTATIDFFNMIHKSAFSSILDLIRYQELKQKSLKALSAPFSNSKRMVIVTDSVDKNDLPYSYLPQLQEKFGSSNIRVLVLHQQLPQIDHPKNVSVTCLTGNDTNQHSATFINTIDELTVFNADTFLIRMHSPASVLRRILLRLSPDIRISLGDTLPAPYSNITFHNPSPEITQYL